MEEQSENTVSTTSASAQEPPMKDIPTMVQVRPTWPRTLLAGMLCAALTACSGNAGARSDMTLTPQGTFVVVYSPMLGGDAYALTVNDKGPVGEAQQFSAAAISMSTITNGGWVLAAERSHEIVTIARGGKITIQEAPNGGAGNTAITDSPSGVWVGINGGMGDQGYQASLFNLRTRKATPIPGAYYDSITPIGNALYAVGLDPEDATASRIVKVDTTTLKVTPIATTLRVSLNSCVQATSESLACIESPLSEADAQVTDKKALHLVSLKTGGSLKRVPLKEQAQKLYRAGNAIMLISSNTVTKMDPALNTLGTTRFTKDQVGDYPFQASTSDGKAATIYTRFPKKQPQPNNLAAQGTITTIDYATLKLTSTTTLILPDFDHVDSLQIAPISAIQ